MYFIQFAYFQKSVFCGTTQRKRTQPRTLFIKASNVSQNLGLVVGPLILLIILDL